MASKPGKGNKKSNKISVDFEGVESGGGGNVPEGNYSFDVDEVEKKTSDNSGADYLALKLKINDGPHKGKTLYHNCSLQPQALFNLRGFLESLGYEVPDGPMDLDIDDLVGESGACAVAHEMYEGKQKARCVEFFTVDELEERNEGGGSGGDDKPKKAGNKKAEKPDDDDDDKGKGAKKTTKKAAKKEPEFEVGDTVTFEDDEGDEQTGEITEIDGDEITVKTGKGKKAVEWTLEPDDLTKVEE